jgi:methoxymalonate biosynthesis acyl carrier protein
MESTMISTKPKIRSFLAGFIQECDLQDHEDIFATGRASSLFIIQLVLFIEKEFGVTLDGDDLDNNNFRTIDAIDTLVTRKLTSFGE